MSIPVPEVCSQKPGFSAVWDEARPFAMAVAAPLWSDASAVSIHSCVSVRGDDWMVTA